MLEVNTIKGRLRLLVTAKTPEKKRFEHLEQETGIPSATWRTWWRREGTPSGQMIEAAAKTWPEHAFWLITGITDVEAGHTMPSLPDSVANYLAGAYGLEADEVEKLVQELKQSRSR